MTIRTIGAVFSLLALGLAADLPTIEPKDAAAQLQGSSAKPALFHVGFAVMYRGKHILVRSPKDWMHSGRQRRPSRAIAKSWSTAVAVLSTGALTSDRPLRC